MIRTKTITSKDLFNKYLKTHYNKLNKKDQFVYLTKKQHEKIISNSQFVEIYDPNNEKTEHYWTEEIRKCKAKIGLYNTQHILDKYDSNKDFWEIMGFKRTTTILDGMAGISSYWKRHSNYVTTNDMHVKGYDYNEDTGVLLQRFVDNCETREVVDIDPYWHVGPFVRNAIKVATKGLILTFGETVPTYNRYKNETILFKQYWGIDFFTKFKGKDKLRILIDLTIKIGVEEGKILIPRIEKDFTKISRVYFEIK